MRTLAIEWARFNIKLCAVAAGQFDTEVLRTRYPKQVSENVARTVPLGRLGTPEEMAWLIAYLASPQGTSSRAPCSRSTAGATTGSARGRRPGRRTKGSPLAEREPREG